MTPNEISTSEIHACLVQYLRDWFAKNGPDSPAVLGISGGKDSTVVAALLCEALGPDRVYGLLLPDGLQKDLDDSIEVAKRLGIHWKIVNIQDCTDAFYETAEVRSEKSDMTMRFDETTQVKVTPQARQNLPPRVRMTMLYFYSQCLNGRVVGTTNCNEWWAGWFTKGGDAVADVEPLIELTVDQIVNIGLEIPALKGLECLVHKAPSDGLCGLTDEEKLGFTYADMTAYLHWREAFDDEFAPCPVARKVATKIEQKIASTAFKRRDIDRFRLY